MAKADDKYGRHLAEVVDVLHEWRVDWLSFGRETRSRTFTSKREARKWFDYVTTGWGPEATATLFRREVEPWEEVDGRGPLKLDHEGARHG